MNIRVLEDVFNQALENGKDVAIEVTIPGQEDTEFIVNKNRSILNKLSYYKKIYGDTCVHGMNDAIKIVNAFELDFKGGK